jgi:hypothetical protein
VLCSSGNFLNGYDTQVAEYAILLSEVNVVVRWLALMLPNWEPWVQIWAQRAASLRSIRGVLWRLCAHTKIVPQIMPRLHPVKYVSIYSSLIFLSFHAV